MIAGQIVESVIRQPVDVESRTRVPSIGQLQVGTIEVGKTEKRHAEEDQVGIGHTRVVDGRRADVAGHPSASQRRGSHPVVAARLGDPIQTTCSGLIGAGIDGRSHCERHGSASLPDEL